MHENLDLQSESPTVTESTTIKIDIRQILTGEVRTFALPQHDKSVRALRRAIRCALDEEAKLEARYFAPIPLRKVRVVRLGLASSQNLEDVDD